MKSIALLLISACLFSCNSRLFDRNQNSKNTQTSINPISEADLEIVTFKVEANDDGTARVFLQANQASEGVISFEHNGELIKIPINIAHPKEPTIFNTDVILNDGIEYIFNASITNGTPPNRNDSAQDIVLIDSAPSLKISELRVKKIEDGKITVVTKVNSGSKGKICFDKNGEEICKQVDYNNKALKQEIELDGSGIDQTTIKLVVENKDNQKDEKEIQVDIKNLEPSVIASSNDKLIPLDYFMCGNIKSNQKISIINIGGNDQFTGAKNYNDFPADPEFIDSTIKHFNEKYGYQYIYKHTNFDSFEAKDDMFTFAEASLNQYKNINCIVAKIKGKQMDQWWTTDQISFYSAPNSINNYKDILKYPFIDIFTADESSYEWCSPSTKEFIKIVNIKNTMFLRSISKHQNLKFLYQDDSMIDYLELYIVHDK